MVNYYMDLIDKKNKKKAIGIIKLDIIDSILLGECGHASIIDGWLPTELAVLMYLESMK